MVEHHWRAWRCLIGPQHCRHDVPPRPEPGSVTSTLQRGVLCIFLPHVVAALGPLWQVSMPGGRSVAVRGNGRRRSAHPAPHARPRRRSARSPGALRMIAARARTPCESPSHVTAPRVTAPAVSVFVDDVPNHDSDLRDDARAASPITASELVSLVGGIATIVIAA